MDHCRPGLRCLIHARVWLCAAALILLSSATAGAQSRGKRAVEPPGPSDAPRAEKIARAAAETRKPADFKSTHFLIHTDLPSKDAHELLRRLEVMLGLVAKYWGQPLNGTIEAYVVKDLANWPADSLDPAGRAKIETGAGITLVETLNQGRRTVAAKAVVYAVADHGTPQHEAVHAYCGQTFGRVGPLWYSEGMAELGNYWRPNDASVRCPDYVIDYIRHSHPKPLAEILAEDGADRPGRPVAATGDSWQNYAWRWALCQLLENNPNYSSRFRPLGLGYLTEQPVSFADSYGAMAKELAFEYRFFVSHLDTGYRVDLCRWDWNRKYKDATITPLAARVMANRGWQPSGAMVSPDRTYDYSASGVWRTGKDESDTTADGSLAGAGRLEGVIFQNFTLGEPFALGAYGTFTPPSAGQLYLRCRDRWNELADNRGMMSVKIKRTGGGTKLARPTRTVEEPADEAADGTNAAPTEKSPDESSDGE